MAEASEYVTLEEACELLGKTDDEFKELVEEKGLRSFRDGEVIKFRRAEVMGMVDSKLNLDADLDDALKSDDDFLLFTEEERSGGSDTLELAPDEDETGTDIQLGETIQMDSATDSGTKADTKADTKSDTKSDIKSDTKSDLDLGLDTKDDTRSETKIETDATEMDSSAKDTSEELDLGEDFFELEPMDEEEDTGTAGVFDQLDIIEEEEESGSTDEVTGQLVADEESGAETLLESAEELEEGEEISPEEVAEMGARFDHGITPKPTAEPVGIAWPVILIVAAIAGVWALLMAVNQLVPNSGIQSINQVLVDLFKK